MRNLTYLVVIGADRGILRLQRLAGGGHIGHDARPEIAVSEHAAEVVDLFARIVVLLNALPFALRRSGRLNHLLHFAVGIVGHALPTAFDRVMLEADEAGCDGQARGSRGHPRLLGPPHTGLQDVSRQKVRVDCLQPQPMQRQAVGGSHVQRVVTELLVLVGLDTDAVEAARPLHLHLKLLFQELAQSRQAEGRTDPYQPRQVRVSVQALVVAKRTLQLLHQIRKDRPHRLKDLPSVLTRAGLALELLRLGVAELERADQRLGEVIAANGESAEPDAPLLHNDHIRGHRADVHIDGAFPLLLLLVVVTEGVVNGDRREGQRLDCHAGGVIVAQHLPDALFVHGKDADLDLRRLFLFEDLIVPFHLLDRERDLLHRLVLDDLRHLFGLDRRQLRETGEGHVPGHGGDDLTAAHLVLGQELAKLFLNRLIDIDIGRGEHLVEGDQVVVGHLDAVAGADQAHRFDGTGADFDAPTIISFGHAKLLVPDATGPAPARPSDGRSGPGDPNGRPGKPGRLTGASAARAPSCYFSPGGERLSRLRITLEHRPPVKARFAGSRR